MAVEVSKQKELHKPAAHILFTGLVITIALGSFVAINPSMSERMARALFSPGIHITPSKSGLASVELGRGEQELGLGDAVTAGDRLRVQMNLISASEK